jgi:hypothetical protein
LAVEIILLFIGIAVAPTLAVADNNTRVSSFSRNGFQEQAYLYLTHNCSNSEFGIGVDINENYAIVGADRDNNNMGSATIYRRNGTEWVEDSFLTASDQGNDDLFGCAVSMDGDYAVVGAMNDDVYYWHSGSAYVFKHVNDSWIEEAKLLPHENVSKNFGVNVAVDGDYIVVGATQVSIPSSDKGSAYVFKRSGSSWNQTAMLTASDGEIEDHFGYAVDIKGGYIVIGAYRDNDYGAASGSVYIFKQEGESWIEQLKLHGSDESSGYEFGIDVAIDGNHVLVGAFHAISYRGVAYLFKKTGNEWIEEKKLLASDGDSMDFFGTSVAVKGDFLLIGAQLACPSDTGAAYLYKYNGTDWNEVQKLVPDNASNQDDFGYESALGGDYAIVGAYRRDTQYGQNAGSAYVYQNIDPKLNCSKEISWDDVIPGETLNGSIMIMNCGDLNSTLNWSIQSWPEWGQWMLSPMNGTLSGGYSQIIDVSVAAPNEQNRVYSGEILVVNQYYPDQLCIVNVSLRTRFLPSVKLIGGFGVNLVINNTDNKSASAEWSIHIIGGILHRINLSQKGSIDIPASESKTVSSGFFVGLGRITVNAKAEHESITVNGLQILVLTFLNK